MGSGRCRQFKVCQRLPLQRPLDGCSDDRVFSGKSRARGGNEKYGRLTAVCAATHGGGPTRKERVGPARRGAQTRKLARLGTAKEEDLKFLKKKDMPVSKLDLAPVDKAKMENLAKSWGASDVTADADPDIAVWPTTVGAHF